MKIKMELQFMRSIITSMLRLRKVIFEKFICHFSWFRAVLHEPLPEAVRSWLQKEGKTFALV